MDDDQQFCLRWNNHQSTLISVFDTLLEKGIHVDCTLAAEGQTLKAHKVVLSACSPYFENVLSQQYDKHPIIILKDVKYAELRAMMDYMYRGEVNISQDQLAALLKAAESLQIKGLSDNKPARPPGTHAPRQPSPANKASEGSIGSREGSTSPSRRRKKARRASTDGILPTSAIVTVAVPAPVAAVPAAAPAPADDQPAPELPPTECKVEEGSRGAEGEGVEDLTLDEENEEPLPVHNDVVRNFQWHMERSQDEMMNADGARDSQGSTAGKNGDRPMIKQKINITEKASTYVVLHNAVLPNEAMIYSKVDDIDDKNNVKLPLLPKQKETTTDKIMPSNTPTKENKKTVKLDDKGLKGDTSKKEEKVPKKRGRPFKKDKQLTAEKLDKNKDDSTSKTVTRGQVDKDEKKEQVDKEKKKEKGLKKEKEETDDNDKDNKKKSVYDFDYYSSDTSAPLPCSEHKTDKGYKCPNCNRCYNARKNLVRHITLECGRDPQYQCPHCPYSKHRRNELKKHIQKKHSTEPEKAIKRKH